MQANNTTPNVSGAQVENLVSDLRGMLDGKDLDSIPQVKAARERLDSGLRAARQTAIDAAHDAARQARDAARAANEYAHNEPWRVAGAALAVGALVGFLIARR